MQRNAGTISSEHRSDIIALDHQPTPYAYQDINEHGEITRTDNTNLSKNQEDVSDDNEVGQLYAVYDLAKASHRDITQPYSVQNLTSPCAVQCSDDVMVENVVYESMDIK